MNNTLTTLIARALAEDIGSGDITTEAIVKKRVTACATIGCRQDLVVSGLDVAHKVFASVDKSIVWTPAKNDGDACTAGDILAEVHGNAAGILSAERVALNFLQHLSGIATVTRRFVDAVDGTGVKISDTRKTTPGLRALEKKAVVDGGGVNHRMGLYDRYLIKNNHIDIAGSVRKAIADVKAHRNEYVLIEVEVRDLAELKDAVTYDGVDIVMLDNWQPEAIDAAVAIARDHAMIEISGGITLDNIRDYARPGIAYISVGALTHSAPAADINMHIRPESRS